MSIARQERLWPLEIDEGAIFSPDRKYRYRLWRSIGNRKERCVFVGLNPSKADEHKNDMTITKCIGFAQRWGFDRIDMVNLFALVSTDPTKLISAVDRDGRHNDTHLACAFRDAARIVWAWGKHPPLVRQLIKARVGTVLWLRDYYGGKVPSGSLGWLSDGPDIAPRHPSRAAYSTRWVPS
jgi:hypothetical protein